MALTWSSGSGFAPPISNAPPFPSTLGSFTFIDFLPECSSRGGFFKSAKYENFRTLVDRANVWLRSNPNFKVITCESVEFTARNDQVYFEKMVYIQYGEAPTSYIRGLRLWITETPDQENTQQIGYLNLVPEQLKKPGVFSSPIYESLDDLLRRFNNSIHTNPIPGRVLTIESQELKDSFSKEIDPDRSMWSESGSMRKWYLFIIRVFYEISDGIPEEIGVVDFAPVALTKGGIFKLPKYENFSNVISKASSWCMAQQGIRICNIQSLEMKIERGLEVDTHKMQYVESGSMNTYYLRILRVAYTKPRDGLTEEFSLQNVSCKTFMPHQITRGIFMPEFENLQETKNRVQAWVKATGVKVISAETTAIRMNTSIDARLGPEASLTYNRAETSEYFIFIIRLYINGSYYEPPPEMLPQIPEIQPSSCTLL